MGDDITIEGLSKQIPEGGSHLFERPIKDDVEERFLSVHSASQQVQAYWDNKPPLEKTPWFGSRRKKRIPISTVPEPDISFAGQSTKIVDLYSTGTHAFLMSDRLATLIEAMDPGSLDRRVVTITAKDKDVDYNMVMPARVLEAVDLSRSDVLVKDKDYGGRFLRMIYFHGDVAFRKDRTENIHHFTDVDTLKWYWSRELIDAVISAGMRGLYTKAVWGENPTVEYL